MGSLLVSRLGVQYFYMSEYICEICGKAFKSAPARSGHQRVHQSLAQGKIHECSTCGRAFSSLSSLNTHSCKTLSERRAESRNKKKPERLQNNGFHRPQILYCEYCNKECHNQNSLIQHEIRCKKNPNKINTYNEGFNQNREYTPLTPWNKGLTKETSAAVAAYSEKAAETLRGRPGHLHTEEEKLHLSKIACERGLGGINWRVGQLHYKGIRMDSKYEIATAESLDEYGIRWQRPVPPLYFTTIDGKRHRYIADFYLPDYQVFLDPKNDYLIHNDCKNRLGLTGKEKIDLVAEQNQVRILILDKDHLTWDRIKTLLES